MEHLCDITQSRVRCLDRKLLAKELLEGLAVLSELLNTLMELIKRHLVLEEGPAEIGLVVNEGDLRYLLCLSAGCRGRQGVFMI